MIFPETPDLNLSFPDLNLSFPDLNLLSSDLSLLSARAFDAARRNLGWTVTFVRPENTLALSLTGAKCLQACAHCNSRYLGSMIDIDDLLSSPGDYIDKYKSILVSGGFMEDMRIPLYENRDKIKKLKKMGFELNFHAQRLDDKDVPVLLEYASAVSVDYIASEDVIKRVYKSRTFRPGETLKNIFFLRERVKVVVHITLGIDRGVINHEYRALDDLKDMDYLVINILRAGKNTEFQNVAGPDLKSIFAFFCFARLGFPFIPLCLGCMRPGGKRRLKIDNLALMAGFDTIVNPGVKSMEFALLKGLDPLFFDQCCALGAGAFK